MDTDRQAVVSFSHTNYFKAKSTPSCIDAKDIQRKSKPALRKLRKTKPATGYAKTVGQHLPHGDTADGPLTFRPSAIGVIRNGRSGRHQHRQSDWRLSQKRDTHPPLVLRHHRPNWAGRLRINVAWPVGRYGLRYRFIPRERNGRAKVDGKEKKNENTVSFCDRYGPVCGWLIIYFPRNGKSRTRSWCLADNLLNPLAIYWSKFVNLSLNRRLTFSLLNRWVKLGVFGVGQERKGFHLPCRWKNNYYIHHAVVKSINKQYIFSTHQRDVNHPDVFIIFSCIKRAFSLGNETSSIGLRV